MFIYDFIQVDVPFEDVKAHITGGSDAWLSDVATAAYNLSEHRLRAAGFSPDREPGSVRVTIGMPYERNHLVTMPMSWRADEASGVFAVLDGELELSRLHDGTTHIALLGRYEPALGFLGRLLDRISMHHLAEAGIRAFLQLLADELAHVTPAA